MPLPGISYAPKDVTPKKFFEEWLPGQFAKVKALVMPFAGEVNAAMAIKVTGAGGGEWSCGLSAEGLKVEAGLREDAVVTLVLSEPNFREAVTGERQMMGMGGGGQKMPAADKVPALIRRQLEALRQIQGMIEFRMEDAKSGDFTVRIKFAGPMKDEPDASVSLAREDAEAIGRGELNPQAAFMSGRMKIGGDMMLLMQMTPLMTA
jgi:hypothetical protein